jgi:hypothetical protein
VQRKHPSRVTISRTNAARKPAQLDMKLIQVTVAKLNAVPNIARTEDRYSGHTPALAEERIVGLTARVISMQLSYNSAKSHALSMANCPAKQEPFAAGEPFGEEISTVLVKTGAQSERELFGDGRHTPALYRKSIAWKKHSTEKEKERNLDCSDENRSAIGTRALWRWHGK